MPHEVTPPGMFEHAHTQGASYWTVLQHQPTHRVTLPVARRRVQWRRRAGWRRTMLALNVGEAHVEAFGAVDFVAREVAPPVTRDVVKAQIRDQRNEVVVWDQGDTIGACK